MYISKFAYATYDWLAKDLDFMDGSMRNQFQISKILPAHL